MCIRDSVVVVLQRHVVAGVFQGAVEGVADDAAAGAAEGDRPGGVGADALDLGFAAGAMLNATEAGRVGQNAFGQALEPGVGQTKVDEPGRRDTHLAQICLLYTSRCV